MRQGFKALYTFDQNSEQVQLLYGEKAPLSLDASQIQAYFKYDSGAKEFKVLPGNKSFSQSVDAVQLMKSK